MNSKLRKVAVLIAVSLALAWCMPAMGQVLKGSISGTVVDPQAAIVGGAQVKATQSGTGAVYNTTSDNSGLFRFSLIPAGAYKIEVTKQGFKTSVQNDVLVSAGRESSLGSVKLSVGEASTTVEVTAETPLIEPTQSQVTNTFAGTTLNTFAGVGENQGLDSLALFIPGVASSRDNNFSNTNGGGGFSVNGLRGRNNDQQIDGQNNNDNSVAGPGLFVSDSEFVQQYVAVTNQFGPEYGRNAGSVVNIITKSGTNAWHGSIYGSENNSVLNSLTNNQKRFQDLKQVPRLNDEFTGFTVSGPIVKNKLFFFGGFDDELISTQNPFHSDNLTPTPSGLATLAGCFPTSTSLQALSKFGPYGISAGGPTPTNPVSLSVGACNNVQFGGVTRILSTPVHIFNWIGKTDWQLGSDNISARYIFNRVNFFNADDNGAAGYVFNVPALSQATLVSWTHNFTAHMVNEARVSFNRLNVEFGGNTIGNTEPTANQVDQALANVSIQAPGFLGFGPATNLPQGRIVNTWQAQDNWNYVLGKHQLKAGVNFTYQRSPNVFLPNLNGSFRFASFAAFANNVPNRVNVAQGPSSLDFREYDTFFYVGDDWKVTPSLTLNLGLTYSYFGQPANLFNDITTKRENNPATAFWNPALPLSVRAYPKTDTYTKAFGPSVGFAYSPQWGGWLTGNGKTVLRGGYRLAYDPAFYNIYLNISTSTPEVFLQSLTGASAAANKLPANPTGPNVRAQLAPFLVQGVRDPRTFNETLTPTNFSPDRVQSYSLGIQREITKNSAFEARYVGNKAENLFQTVNANPFIADLKTAFPNLVPAGLTPCAATQQIGPGAGTDVGRVSCGTGVERSRTNTGYSYYNGLQLEFRANNLFKQLTMRTSYTWAKTLDNASEIFSTGAAGNSNAFAQNALDVKKGEYGFSGLDYPGTWTLLFSEQLPFFKDQKGWFGHALGGWGVSANYILQSGQRYTPVQVFSAGFTNTFPTELGGVNPNCHLGGPCPFNFYDAGFIGGFVGIDTARPFIGNPNAPNSSVGVFAQDACLLFSATGGGPLCDPANAQQLVSLNVIGQPVPGDPQKRNCETSNIDCPFVKVTKNDVRYILNSFTAQQLFGTPFGNSGRNVAQDALTNIVNFGVFKRIKLSERAAFEFHATMINAFNHPNFQSVDPFLEDTGLTQQGTGFADPTLTNSVQRRIIFAGKITF
ncbi:MAG TPA: TonB-dependent receptor [Candidatus Angelobacter sp.]|nr:TonB-dependent receptor [Candidatus Angelobacter sp.]